MLTAAGPGQDERFLRVVAQCVNEDRLDKALREAAAELATRGPRYALSVLIDYVRKESV